MPQSLNRSLCPFVYRAVINLLQFRCKTMADPKGAYRFRNGRRYHGHEEEAYYLPNDEAEVDRLGNIIDFPPPNVILR